MKDLPSIAELVPHSGRMIVLDRMTAWSDGCATAEALLCDDSTYVVDGVLPTITTIEHMAQTVAACLGYEAFRAGDGVRVGMVIASRSFELLVASVATGTTVTIQVEKIRGNEMLSHFNGSVTVGDATISTANLTVYHAESPPDEN